jgi:hypothetical protein
MWGPRGTAVCTRRRCRLGRPGKRSHSHRSSGCRSGRSNIVPRSTARETRRTTQAGTGSPLPSCRWVCPDSFLHRAVLRLHPLPRRRLQHRKERRRPSQRLPLDRRQPVLRRPSLHPHLSRRRADPRRSRRRCLSILQRRSRCRCQSTLQRREWRRRRPPSRHPPLLRPAKGRPLLRPHRLPQRPGARTRRRAVRPGTRPTTIDRCASAMSVVSSSESHKRELTGSGR